ncbi:hypothetical protein SESBI_13349 [Sesbania bispinosa]|nr:hypothetical protein SESBI_13349 [Sesbania bispinosa]
MSPCAISVLQGTTTTPSLHCAVRHLPCTPPSCLHHVTPCAVLFYPKMWPCVIAESSQVNTVALHCALLSAIAALVEKRRWGGFARANISEKGKERVGCCFF